MHVVKVTAKGQVTIPVELRHQLGITEDTYVEVTTNGHVIAFRPIVSVEPLSEEDPIWSFIGVADGGAHDVAARHDEYLGEARIGKWRKSS